MKIYCSNVDKMEEEAYALIRKDTFGASDVAALFGVGFQTQEELIANKQKKFLTSEEREIGRKPNVRKGKDLEPLIKAKVEEAIGFPLRKPIDMYEIIPGLTVNFDALSETGIPYELKFVSTFGKNAWVTTAGMEYMEGNKPDEFYRNNIKEHILHWSSLSGIPAYYYTQIQTQLMGAEKEYGFVCALFEHDWTLRIYKVFKDPYFQVALRMKVEELRDRLKEEFQAPVVEY